MSPELINAIKERLQAGQSREEIESAVLSMGHTKEVCAAAYTLAEHDIQNKSAAELPRARDLFKNAWEFAQSRFDLVALLFIPLVLETLGSFWFERLPEGDRFVNAPLLLLFLATGIAYVVTIAIALKIVATKDDSQKTIPTAFAWMITHALPLLWVLILSGLLIFGGLLFFVIPGLIVAISVTFAQYAFVDEDKRGMEALIASHALVRGRWWKVVRKIFGFVILTLIPLFLFGILYGVGTLVVGEGTYVMLAGEILTQAISAVMSLMSLHAMYHLYQALKERSADVAPGAYVRPRYLALILLCLASIAALVAVATFFSEKLEWLEEAATPIETIETRGIPAAFTGFDEAALQFANERNGSYAGVCEVLRPLAEVEGEVTCNDNETAWALQTTDSFGVRYCADSTTPGKMLPTPIGSRTECISVE